MAFSVSLRNMGLIELPDLSQLTSLKLLDLSRNESLFLHQPPIDRLSGLSGLQCLEHIDLSWTGLPAVPDWIFQLPALKVLHLNNNRLSQVWNLSPNCLNLKELHLFANRLSEIPADIGLLTNLELLDVSNNQLTSLPQEIGSLTKLTLLLVSHNLLESLPREVQSLRQLEVLDLSDNQLFELPAEVANLHSLQWLTLYSNQLTDLPTDIRFLSNLIRLECRKNTFEKPLQEGDLVDSFQPANHLVDSRDGREFVRFAAEWSGGQLALDRFKLALVGDGDAGKTTLGIRLVNNQLEAIREEDWDTRRTTWIQQHEWHPAGVENWHFDIWDFPGQSQHYATHNLFLSDWQCVFLIVCNLADEHWNARLKYWVSFLACKSSFVMNRYHRHHIRHDFVSRGTRNEADATRPVLLTIVIGSHLDLLPSQSNPACGLNSMTQEFHEQLQEVVFEVGGAFDLKQGDLQALAKSLVKNGTKMFQSSRRLVPKSYGDVLGWIQSRRTRVQRDRAPVISFGALMDEFHTEMAGKSNNERIEKHRMVWILKQLHSFGEVVFFLHPGTNQRIHSEEISNDEPVVLSFTWLLACIGKLLDKHDPTRDGQTRQPSKLKGERLEIIEQSKGRLPLEDLAGIWGLTSNKDITAVLRILERMLLCYSSKETWIFPLLCPSIRKEDRQKYKQDSVLTACRWFRSQEKQTLPPGAFGMFQVKLSELDSSIAGDVIVITYLNESLLIINGHLLIAISAHNPSLAVEGARAYRKPRTQAPMLCICCFENGADDEGGSKLGGELWRSVIQLLYQVYWSYAGDSISLQEEIPCIECVRAKWAEEPKFSVCDAFSKAECLDLSYDEKAKYRCDVTNMLVCYRDYLTGEPESRSTHPSALEESVPSAASPAEPLPIRQGARTIQRYHLLTDAGDNAIRGKLELIARELNIDDTSVIDLILASLLVQIEQYLRYVIKLEILSGFEFLLSDIREHESAALLSVLVVLNDPASPVEWNSQVGSCSFSGQELPPPALAELFKAFASAIEHSCICPTSADIVAIYPRPGFSLDRQSAWIRIGRREIPVDFTPIIQCTTPGSILRLYADGTVNEYVVVDHVSTSDIPGLQAAINICVSLLEYERAKHQSNVRATIIQFAALDATKSIPSGSQLSLLSLIQRCFSHILNVLQPTSSSTAYRSTNDISRGEHYHLISAILDRASNRSSLSRWLEDLRTLSTRALTDRLETLTECPDCRNSDNNPRAPLRSGSARADAELWGLAKERQASTALGRSQFFRADIDGLCESFAQRLNDLYWFGLDLTWSCEFFFGGSSGNNVAVVQLGGELNDLDLLLVMTPTSMAPNTKVSIGLQRGLGSKFNKCCLDVTSFGALTHHDIDDSVLEDVWEAFHDAVTEFINHHGFLEKDIELKEDSTARQMRCSFTINDTPIDVLPALKTSGIHLILRRKVDVDGSNVVRSFGIRAARQIGSLHPKASWMICVLKHIAKIERGIDAPGCLFEAVVLEIFGKNGWIKGHPDGTIRFSQVWHDCWEMIGSAESISPPGAAADEGENLFSRMGDNEHRLRELAGAMASLGPKDLKDVVQDVDTARSIASRASQSQPTLASSSTASTLVPPIPKIVPSSRYRLNKLVTSRPGQDPTPK